MSRHDFIRPETPLFHGTYTQLAIGIAHYGFNDGRWLQKDPYLGYGVYVAAHYDSAAFFGDVVLEVALEPGTRLVDASVDPDPKVLRYLRREFGKDILSAMPWKVVPGNKQLRLEEVVALVRHGWREAFEGSWNLDRYRRWQRWRAQADYATGLGRFLHRYGIHGFGDAATTMGVVIFASDRVLPRAVVEARDLPTGPIEQLRAYPKPPPERPIGAAGRDDDPPD